MTGLVTYSGTVSAYVLPQFTLLTSDGQAILAQLGNQSYVASLGLVLQDGDAVTVTGFVDSSGALAVTSITNLSTGATYTLRDGTSGRPAWAGGARQ
jgi:NaMN:DMB phosphoribosyltransferase